MDQRNPFTQSQQYLGNNMNYRAVPGAFHEHDYARSTAQATQSPSSGRDPLAPIAQQYYDNANAPRVNTDIFIYNALKTAHPDLHILDVEQWNADILFYLQSAAGATFGSAKHVTSEDDMTWPGNLNWTYYAAPSRRLDGGIGSVVQRTIFGQYLIEYKGHEFMMYLSDTRDGTFPGGLVRQYILTSDPGPANELVRQAGHYSVVEHEEIWVFDSGYWQKSHTLWQSIQKSRWDDVILDKALKEDLLSTVLKFYNSRDVYQKLRVPWKRGLIFYGPPGNGKTISIKATMKTLQDRNPSVPTLYVKSLKSFGGSEYSITQIFLRARQFAPCYLVFEDLDSLVSDDVRSFFLNAVDGLSENEGILMVGSTNHLDRLDPGIAKRPSRFDRKYLFPDPNFEQRVAYCHFWQTKLEDNKTIEFPDLLCPAIAKLTDKFSFAYMQEAFVSALLNIATGGGDIGKGDAESKDESRLAKELRKDAWDLVDLATELGSKKDKKHSDEKKLEKYVLYREIKMQIEKLREEIKDEQKR